MMVNGCVVAKEPVVALIVAVVVVGTAVVLAETVSDAVPDPGAATAVRDKVALTPAGRPLNERPTTELTPVVFTLITMVAF